METGLRYNGIIKREKLRAKGELKASRKAS